MPRTGRASPIQDSLGTLVSKLAPATTGVRKAGNMIKRPVQKGEISEILTTTERQKTYFVLALKINTLSFHKPSKTTSHIYGAE